MGYVPVADILSAGVVNSDDDEDVLKMGADVLGGERQRPWLLEDDRHDVIPYVPLPQQLGNGHQRAEREVSYAGLRGSAWTTATDPCHPPAPVLSPQSGPTSSQKEAVCAGVRSHPSLLRALMQFHFTQTQGQSPHCYLVGAGGHALASPCCSPGPMHWLFPCPRSPCRFFLHPFRTLLKSPSPVDPTRPTFAFLPPSLNITRGAQWLSFFSVSCLSSPTQEPALEDWTFCRCDHGSLLYPWHPGHCLAYRGIQ